MEFEVIDTSKQHSHPLRTTDYNMALHEYLSMINHMLGILVKYHVKIALSEVDITPYCFTYQSHSHNSYPFIANIYSLDLTRLRIVSKGEEYDIPNIYPFNELKESIKQNLNQLTLTTQTSSSQKPPNFILKPKPVEPHIRRQMDSIVLPKETEDKPETIKPPNNPKSPKTLKPPSPEIEVDDIKKTIDELKKMKEVEANKLEELKKKHTEDTEKFADLHNKLGDKRRELRKEVEREEERRRVFQADKQAYKKMKQHISEKKLEEANISELFINKYPIFKFMDGNNLLDTPNDYIVYSSLYNEMHQTKKGENDLYVPHNIHYLSEEEQQQYAQIKTNYKDDIEEFMTGKRKYPSIESVLHDVDNNELVDVDCNVSFAS